MASKRHVRRKSCEGKIRYTSPQKAMMAAHVVSAKKRELFHHYKCDFGTHWHVGHRRPTMQSRIGF